MEKLYLQLLKKASRSRILSMLLFPLTLISALFWVGTLIRRCVLQKKVPKAPVVTVGNVSLGGTGKTPFLMHLLKHMKGSVAYVSRGYGRKEEINFVGKSPLCTYEKCGDEAMQIARRFGNVVLSISKDKWEAVLNVPEDVRLILLDDGLQRYDIQKTIEIATIDIQNPDGYGGLLPRGLLREPLSRLKKVDYLVLTHIPPAINLDVIREKYMEKFHVPTIAVRTSIARFFLPDGSDQQLSKNTPVALFSTVGSPERVRELMEEEGFVVVDHLVCSDHGEIQEKVLKSYCERVKKEFPHAVLIGTEKDFVKKKEWGTFPLPLLFSEIDMSVVGGKGEFENLLKQMEGFVCEHV